MKCLILLALAAAACADPVLLNYPYEGTNTYVPDQPYFRHYISDYPAVYRSVYPQYVASRAFFPAAAPVAVAAPAAVAIAEPAPVVTPEGYLADTPEVATLKAHHFNVIAKTLARS
ncbi:hypothetical protein J6590_000889 [Homalodisca vitripennis]|nr:hypothetical protein J6590_000889 [Homalodisca vitripennis]